MENKETLARLVLIEWSDSRQPTNAWVHITDIGKRKPVECVSVGFLIQDDDDVKVLAANIGDVDEEMQATGVITIPTVAVHAVKPLVEKTTSSSPSASKRKPQLI